MSECRINPAKPFERDLLRRLAERVAEIASMPIQNRRIDLWKRFNVLKPQRPMVLAYPEGGWRDLIPEQELECTDPLLRKWELSLRKTIYQFEHIHDDQPVTNNFNIGWCVEMGHFGLCETVLRSSELGSFGWQAPIKDHNDLRQLHFRKIEIHRQDTFRQIALAKEIFGDILNVRIHGPLWWTCSLTENLIRLRGLEQVMMDMYDNPQLLHDLMALLRDDMFNMLETFEREGVLTPNWGGEDMVGSAGVGAIDELPAPDYHGITRLCDMWVLGEGQALVGVGPEQFYEFALHYELPILNRFGLVCYGCCEPLDSKFDLIMKHIPRLRRVSVSPWCNRGIAAEKLGDKYIYSWKPNPASLCSGSVDYKKLEKDIQETLDIAKGCCIEIIMKDTHTFQGDRRRVSEWSRIASEIVCR